MTNINKTQGLDRDATRVTLSQQGNQVARKESEESKRLSRVENQGSAGDSVKVALGRAIGAEFDPTKMAAERREKVERLKALVESGQYSAGSSEIASSVVAEIGFEIVENRAGNQESE